MNEHDRLMSWPSASLFARDRRHDRAGRLTVRDEHYTPFKGSPPSEPLRLEAVTVFVMARLRGDRTDAMRRSKRYDALWHAAREHRMAPSDYLRTVLGQGGTTPTRPKGCRSCTIAPHARGRARAALTRSLVMAERAAPSVRGSVRRLAEGGSLMTRRPTPFQRPPRFRRVTLVNLRVLQIDALLKLGYVREAVPVAKAGA